MHKWYQYQQTATTYLFCMAWTLFIDVWFLTATVDHHYSFSLSHSYRFISWCDEQMISIPAVNNNLFILHGMDFIYWRFSLWLQPLTITTLYYRGVWTNDVDTSGQQQLIYFTWHGLHFMDVLLLWPQPLAITALSISFVSFYYCGVKYEWYRYQLAATTYLFLLFITASHAVHSSGSLFVWMQPSTNIISLYRLITVVLWAESNNTS